MLPSFAEIETIFPVISVCFPHMINQTYFLNCLQVWLAGSALVDIVIAVSMVILVSLYISFRTYGPQATRYSFIAESHRSPKRNTLFLGSLGSLLRQDSSQVGPSIIGFDCCGLIALPAAVASVDLILDALKEVRVFVLFFVERY